jgi:CRP-like cAMP-binding protein
VVSHRLELCFHGYKLVPYYRITVLILEKRPVKLTADEQFLYEKNFNILEPREFVKLMTIAQWKNGNPGDKIIEKGKEATEIYIITEGKARASGEKENWFLIATGELLGTTAALLGQPYFFDAECIEKVKYVYFPLGPMRKLMDKNSSLRQKVLELENCDLATHLREIECLILQNKEGSSSSDISLF